MREVVAHPIMTLDGVAKIDTVHAAVLWMSNGGVPSDVARQLTQEGNRGGSRTHRRGLRHLEASRTTVAFNVALCRDMCIRCNRQR
jgi:hypothetical protein